MPVSKEAWENKLENFPNLLTEFHPTLNTPSSIDGLDFTKISLGKDKFWWVCKEGHEWEATISNRTKDKRGRGCPYCSGQKLSVERSLAHRRPDLVDEWDNSKNSVGPEEVFYKSSKRFWWVCPNGHSYYTRIAHRSGGHSCSKCSLQVSRPEIRLFTELQTVIRDVEWNTSVCGIKCDLFLPTQGVVIHYDGYRWHRDKNTKDQHKSKKLIRSGYYNIRVREWGLSKLFKNDVMLKKNEDGLSLVKKVCGSLVKSGRFSPEDLSKLKAYVSGNGLRNDQTYQTMVSWLPKPPPERDLLSTHPDLCEEWDYNKNGFITPEHVTFGSDKKVWWRCKEGHSWRVSVKARASSNQSNLCPYCSRKIINYYNNLEKTHPEIFKEWDHELNNNLDLNMVASGTKTKVWWRCSEGHRWKESVSTRKFGRGCPVCNPKNRKLKIIEIKH